MFICLLLMAAVGGAPVVAGAGSAPAAVGSVAGSEQVVTLGADLTLEQRDAMLRVFGLSAPLVQEKGIPLLTVTNAEEHVLLSGQVAPGVIGSRAISSAMVEKLGPGAGISVERYNITFVTASMYGNALVTAGVRDARVIVAAPSPVSGTAALTGVFKAFERATGEQLQPQAKEVAGRELVTTGELARDLGNQGQAAELVARVKERVAGAGPNDPQQVRQIVLQVASELDVRLSQEQADQVTGLAVEIARLGWRADELRTQVQGLREQFADAVGGQGGWLQRIIDYLARLFSRFFAALAAFIGRVFPRSGRELAQ